MTLSYSFKVNWILLDKVFLLLLLLHLLFVVNVEYIRIALRKVSKSRKQTLIVRLDVSDVAVMTFKFEMFHHFNFD